MSSLNITYINTDTKLRKSVEDFLIQWYNDDLYITAYTSGSTGAPKEIKIRKSKMIESARMTGDYLQINENSSALLCLSPDTIAGKMMIIRSIELNLKLTVVKLSSNPLTEEYGDCDFIAMVPLQLMASLQNFPEKLRRIKNIIIGGGTISQSIERKLVENNLSVFHTYGMTETISHVAMRKIGVNSSRYFTAIGGNTFSQIDNRLIIHSPLLEEGTISTNDIIELIDNKHFIFKGRYDFIINTGGVKINPETVEEKLENLIPFPFFISGLKDDLLGEKVILCIESSPFELNKTELQKLLTKYEYPKEIYFINEFIRTESGKINRGKTIENLILDV